MGQRIAEGRRWVSGMGFCVQGLPSVRIRWAMLPLALGLMISLAPLVQAEGTPSDVAAVTAPSPQPTEQSMLTGEEQLLFQAINDYRKNNGLDAIPFSLSLTRVAKTHAQDLKINRPHTQSGCNFHSWSNSGPWTPLCYTADHRQAEKMWDKPKEITGYPGRGYEVVYSAVYELDPDYPALTQNILENLSKSPTHRAVLLNQNEWKEFRWHAMGVGIYKNYATLWFGEVKDGTQLSEQRDVEPKRATKPTHRLNPFKK